MVSGASGGVLGSGPDFQLSREIFEKDPERAKAIVTRGRHKRAGHDPSRWEFVDWDNYRTSVGVFGKRGPWRVGMAELKTGTPDEWMAEACGLPFQTGWYTTLEHSDRGLVMSDVPGEMCGVLPFFDRVVAEYGHRDRPGDYRVLIGGLGLGAVPRWLLRNTPVSVDVVEFDSDIIGLIMEDDNVQDWADPRRMTVHHGDIFTWLYEAPETLRWDAAWFDVWDVISPENLPGMELLHGAYGKRCGWTVCWEQAECEAMAERWLARLGRPLYARGDNAAIVCVDGHLTTYGEDE